MNKHSYKHPRRKNGQWKRVTSEREIYAMSVIAFFCVILPFSVAFPAEKAEAALPMAASVERVEQVVEEKPKFVINETVWTYIGPARDHSEGEVKSIGLTQEKKDSVAVQCELAKRKYGWGERDKSDCYYLLLAIAFRESGYREDAVGDHGNSHGAYQIYRLAHPDVSVEEAKDFDFATSWTLERLVKYGFPSDKFRAAFAHNGFGGDGSYPKSVLATAKKFEQQGL